jgi:hypothetical protein
MMSYARLYYCQRSGLEPNFEKQSIELAHFYQ